MEVTDWLQEDQDQRDPTETQEPQEPTETQEPQDKLELQEVPERRESAPSTAPSTEESSSRTELAVKSEDCRRFKPLLFLNPDSSPPSCCRAIP